MGKRISLVMSALMVIGSLTMAVPPDPKKDCPVGLVCFTVEQAVEIDKRIIELTRNTKIAQAKTRRFGLGATCGAGISVSVESNEVAAQMNLLSCSAGFTIRVF